VGGEEASVFRNLGFLRVVDIPVPTYNECIFDLIFGTGVVAGTAQTARQPGWC
jgi:hypothetical protein